jgi:cytochrome c oxidase cbb3-type subunit 3
MAEIKRRDEIQGDVIHEYDGIEEADNDLPKWWLYIFAGSVFFSIGYWFVYHEFDLAPSLAETYAVDLGERNARFPPVTEEVLLAAREDQAVVEQGRQLFATNCMQCHLDRGQGQIGPNLTDPFWIHGGAPMQIHDTIEDGVLTKGMPAWGSLLGPRGVTAVSAFVLSIRDTNVQGKEPQGERWPPEPAAEPGAPGEVAPAAPAEAAPTEALAPSEPPAPVVLAGAADREPEAAEPTNGTEPLAASP